MSAAAADALLPRFAAHTAGHRANSRAAGPQAPYGDRQRNVLNRESFREAAELISRWPGYGVTPLHDLPGLAAAAGIERLSYKDESGRFGLGSFKALGGAYAVWRQLQRVADAKGEAAPTAADAQSGRFADVTVTCATDGNHGRSVAWGAQTFGCRCVIYVHETVSQGRCDAIARYGAEIRTVPGTYDAAVRRAAADAAANGWTVISDTSYPGYTDIPRDVMQGYTLMADEALHQLPRDAAPTHVFLQAGVGGLAAAVCAHLWETLGGARPRFIVVEPDRAACLYASVAAGTPVSVEGDLDTLMAGLACGEPSLLAWEILEEGADDFMTVTDEAAVDCMRILARGTRGDPSLVAGESAVAGLAALLCAAAQPDLRNALRLTPQSRVLLFGSEGATDAEVYAQLVGDRI